MLIKIHADLTASISDMKRNPQALIDSLAEDIELGRIIEMRKGEKEGAVEVGIDEL
ncbi:MAG: hypothetical protein HGJ94_07990 [Desulfosarcina sp.]|nr:hypothetical protein [Desulfosarcina sp.]